MFWGIAAAAAGLWVLKSMASINKARKSLGDCPGGEIMVLHPFRTLSLVLGSHFPFPGQIGSYFGKFSLYKKYGSTCLSSIVFSNAIPTFWLSDADAIKVVSTDRTVFQKDVEAYETLNIYGPNLVGTEGLDWKRHRRIANPAFNEANNAFVWSETTRFITEWFTEIDKSQAGSKVSNVPIDLLKDLTQLTLLIISSAGFSRRVSWNDDSSLVPPPGHTMAFQPAVASAIHHTIVKILTPDFLYSLCSKIDIPFISPVLREITASFEALRMHMLEVVSSARAWILDNKGAAKDGKMDAALLRNLVEANLAEGSDYRGLTDDELLSNTFTFLLAGHETSAHTLCFAIVFLALYPEVQDKIYEEAVKLWPDGVPEVADLSAYKDSMPKLEYTIATFHETLRHFPSVARLGKPVHADTTLKAKRFTTNIQHTKSTDLQELSNVKEFVVPIPKGSIVIVDIYALHFNPLHWGPDVAEFRPDRFIDTESYRWPRDAFLAFSSGPRSCIGQRFSTTESACILASLVRKYEILVPGDLKSLPFEERKKVMLGCTTGITLTPTSARVELKKRV